jgi:hypothetical protein
MSFFAAHIKIIVLLYSSLKNFQSLIKAALLVVNESSKAGSLSFLRLLNAASKRSGLSDLISTCSLKNKLQTLMSFFAAHIKIIVLLYSSLKNFQSLMITAFIIYLHSLTASWSPILAFKNFNFISWYTACKFFEEQTSNFDVILCCTYQNNRSSLFQLEKLPIFLYDYRFHHISAQSHG